MTCLHSIETKNKRESHQKVCEIKDFSYVRLASEETKILEFNQYRKSDKASLVHYADIECLIGKN